MSSQPFWGYLPKVFFLGFYVFSLTLITFHKTLRRRLEEDTFLLRALGLSVISGLGLGLGFPPYWLLPLIFCGFVPLLIILKHRVENKLSRRSYILLLFNAFIIWNIWSTHWVANSALAAGVVAIVLNSLFMVLPWLMCSWLSRRLNISDYWGLVWAAAWILFEFLHLRWDISWPWLNLGNAMASFPFLAQWYEYTGVLGGTAWILGANFLLYRVYVKIKSAASFRSSIFTAGIWIFIPAVISGIMYFSYTLPEDMGRFSVINPNIEPHYEKFDLGFSEQKGSFDRLIDRALAKDPDLILLPETSFNRINLSSIESNAGIGYLQSKLLSTDYKTKVLTGISAFDIFEKDHVPNRPSIRESKDRSGNTYYWEVYNSAILVGNDSIPVYHKQKLVPGAEIFPYRKLLFFFKPLIDKLGGSIYGYGRPESQNVFTIREIKIGPIICYESVYGEFCRKYVANGANVLGIVTNDGWWDDTEGHKQHYEFAALRAIEYRRSVVRSANLGFCGGFNPLGNELTQPNKYNQPTEITFEAPLNSEITFYAKWGDFMGRFSLFFLIFMGLKGVVETIKSDK
nr:apolipoprotein N-acyltransferase [Membranihabitans maritimus]